jgi:hypothetical protein
VPTPQSYTQTRSSELKDERVQEIYFSLLSVLLPAPGSAEEFNPELLLTILSRSPLIEQVATMLGCDSIEEASRHYGVFNAMLDFFSTLSNHPVTACLVYDDRIIYDVDSGNLLDVSFRSADVVNARAIGKDTGKALISLIQSLAGQAQKFLRHARMNVQDFRDTEGQAVVALCERLCNISTRLVMQNTRSRHDTAACVAVGRAADLGDWHRQHCVHDLPDGILLTDFAFAAEATREAPLQPPKGRMKRLITELATLQTSLPEGIFVRHGSSRLDIMKILIVGPKGTPYEHGFFEFDLYCPLNYPTVAPKVRLRTTNGGKVSFNPNLYKDGYGKCNVKTHHRLAQGRDYKSDYTANTHDT